MKALKVHIYHLIAALFFVVFFTPRQSFGQIINFDEQGRQIVRFSKAGDAIDAHDGEIAQFNGIYYLYGTSYDCGFEWGNKGAPFCGFKVYSSKDLKNWIDQGFLFDAGTPVWQSRCDGKTYGCFRPHVIYNKKTKLYVLWINVYDNVVGYRVFTSKTPVGPFTETAEPKLAVNGAMPAGGLNNGDHDTFVDDDGTAYLAYTDWRAKGAIVIEKLSNDYLTGTGEHVEAVTPNTTEAPGMFKRNGIYYVVYSDPNCGYCSGTGTSYRTAKSPLGPWSDGKKISDNSCGGQPSFVSTIKINLETVYLYGSDLWNNAAKNEALANYYWAPLKFEDDGSIKPLNCSDSYRQPKPHFKGAGIDLKLAGGIAGKFQRSQSFVAARSGLIRRIDLVLFKNHNPDGDLFVSIYKAGPEGMPSGKPLYSVVIAKKRIGWSAKKISITASLNITKGKNYAVVLKTPSASGYYGIAYSTPDNAAGSVAGYSEDGGIHFKKDDKTGSIAVNMVIR